MRHSKAYVSLLGLALLSGCVPLLIGGGTETAVVASQERSVGNAFDDAGILLKIKNQYAQADFRDLLANVEVKVVEGRVLLTGNVDKPESQIKAVDLAWKVDGVREVINEIQINDKAGFTNYAKDVWISTQIKTRLLLEKGVRSVNYSVITVNQVVYVMGIAQDQEELDKVTYICGTTDNVQRVVSYVRMKNDPHRFDTPPVEH